MKKTICKYEYDTDRSQLIKKIPTGEFGDPAGYEETLYCTEDGKYFIYVNGGKASPYPQEDIKRISKDKATLWLSDRQ